MRKILTAFALLLVSAFACAQFAPRTLGLGFQAYTAYAGACPVTVGTLTVSVTTPRSSAISPAFFFLDATGTTDSAVATGFTPFQDVYQAWNFADTNASGTGTWVYGSWPAHNSRNAADGGIAGHLYIIPPGGGDKTFSPIITAIDGTNTASCSVTVTVYDPNGANGFAGTLTTCVAASTTPVAGSGGCPSGAGVLQQSNYNTALTSKLGSGKRVLFKCGDTFTGNDYTYSAVTASIGAYGGCEGTQTNRPIFNTSGTTSGAILVNQNGTTGDLRVADIDCEGAGTGGGCINSPGTISHPSYQVTLSNLNSTGNSESYSYSQGAQWALVELVQTDARGIGTFLNFGENNPPYSGNTVNNLDYAALIGSHISGCSTCTGGGVEDVRISECRNCVIEYNDLLNSNNVGSDLKLHNGNTNGSVATWTGVYTENVMVTDNYFGPNGGGAATDIAAQNGVLDERLRNIVVERNSFNDTATAAEGFMAMFSGQNITVRDNVCYMPASGSVYQGVCLFGTTRGGTSFSFLSSNHEYYNNTAYMPAPVAGQNFIVAASYGPYTTGIPTNTVAKNNMLYSVGNSSIPVVTIGGAGSVSSNNTANPANNPAFTNPSGTMLQTRDYKPTANYSGGTSVPNLYDALGVPWSPTWDLGAVHN